MAHDVFISYSQRDKPTADAACAALETDGIRCWIAPRDVPAGMSWPAAIVGAISQSRVMLLVFSSHAIASEEVQREVAHAFQSRVIVVPFRIEDVHPSGDMAYYMSTTHWMDAMTPPLAAHLEKLCQTIEAILQRSGEKKRQPAKLSRPSDGKAPNEPGAAAYSRQRRIAIGSGLVALIVILLAMLFVEGDFASLWKTFTANRAIYNARSTIDSLPKTSEIPDDVLNASLLRPVSLDGPALFRVIVFLTLSTSAVIVVIVLARRARPVGRG